MQIRRKQFNIVSLTRLQTAARRLKGQRDRSKNLARSTWNANLPVSPHHTMCKTQIYRGTPTAAPRCLTYRFCPPCGRVYSLSLRAVRRFISISSLLMTNVLTRFRHHGVTEPAGSVSRGSLPSGRRCNRRINFRHRLVIHFGKGRLLVGRGKAGASRTRASAKKARR